jgi:20S proteasome alpha/beta subunit
VLPQYQLLYYPSMMVNMTVIMGVNLCDRICLIADSRVSSRNELTGKFTVKHDNMLKIEAINSMKGVAVASAGDANFAKYILKALNRDFSGQKIDSLRGNIEQWLYKIGGEYGKINSKAHANFLVAGVDDAKRKKVNKTKLNSILFGPHMTEIGSGSMRHALFEGLDNAKDGDELLELPVNNTILFSAEVDLQQGVKIKDSAWGDVLISGPSTLAKEEVTEKDFAMLEFGAPTTNNTLGHIEHDGMLMVAIASSLARNHNWLTVGGSYIPMHLYSNMSLMSLPRRIVSYDPVTNLFEEISAHIVENGKFYRVDEKGTKYRLELVSEFKNDKKSRHLALRI